MPEAREASKSAPAGCAVAKGQADLFEHRQNRHPRGHTFVTWARQIQPAEEPKVITVVDAYRLRGVAASRGNEVATTQRSRLQPSAEDRKQVDRDSESYSNLLFVLLAARFVMKCNEGYLSKAVPRQSTYIDASDEKVKKR